MTRERRSNIWLLSGLIVILLFFILFEPSYGWKLRDFFTPSNVVLNGGSGNSDAPTLAENEVLKAQVAQLSVVASEIPTAASGSIRAQVYSRYPLNFKNELLVNAGSVQGVAAGSAVVFQGLLVGRVQTVFSNSSVVQTVFDNNFKMPVRVGTAGYDGLLQGGSYPVVGSIAKNLPIAVNDIVYAAASGLPYGIPIGEVMSTSTSADSLFQQAPLVFSYDINTIQTVLIQK